MKITKEMIEASSAGGGAWVTVEDILKEFEGSKVVIEAIWFCPMHPTQTTPCVHCAIEGAGGRVTASFALRDPGGAAPLEVREVRR